MCTFSYGYLFLVSIFYQLTSEKNQVHISDLTHFRQTLQFIKFGLIKNMEGSRGNLAGTIQVSLLKYFVIFFLSCGKVHIFPHFTVFSSFASLLS